MLWRRLLTVLSAVAGLAALALLWLAWQSPNSLPRPSVPSPDLAIAQNLLPGQPLWVRVNDEIWQLDSTGRLLQKATWKSLGLPGRPSTLQMDVQGRLQAWVPGHARLWTLQPEPLRVLDSRPLLWPVEALQGLTTTRHVSVHADGRVAVCHEASGKVLVFRPDGRLWALTAEGSSRRCGMLWWEDDDLWVSQVLDQGLVQLRSDTLDPIGHVRARPGWPAGSEILTVSRHPRHGIDVHAPLASALVREPTGGSVHLLYLWSDGMSIEQPLERLSRPQHAVWRGTELLVADAHALDWRRFDIDRQMLPSLADEATTAQLRRQFAPPAPTGPTPRQHRLDQAITAATLAVAMVLLLVFSAPATGAKAAPATGAPADLPATAMPMPDPCISWQERWFQRQGRKHLKSLLAHEQFGAQGEHLREAFCLRHPDGLWWLLLSNRRLLQYRLEGGRAIPVLQCSRADLVRVRLTLPAAGRPWQASHLRIELIDGHCISGRLRPVSLARRVAAMLQLRATGPR